MQFKNVLAVFASVMATSAVAVPAPVDAAPKVEARSGECNSNQVLSCCQSFGLLSLICTTTTVIGGLNPTCSDNGNIQCCPNTSNVSLPLEVILEQHDTNTGIPELCLCHLAFPVFQYPLRRLTPPRWKLGVSRLIVVDEGEDAVHCIVNLMTFYLTRPGLTFGTFQTHTPLAIGLFIS